uniref:Uncharacterized protein n=1 Tax=Utricularia reniformis TaxID=192314 RepID=A0A1Y0B2X7_9LAMI|nr:hypothetical protein AEK19_MT1564 [Utricularia reniformis]ART31751.1 hypothetical protein AEK19_MT1564 [Utricularia reniformis]
MAQWLLFLSSQKAAFHPSPPAAVSSFPFRGYERTWSCTSWCFGICNCCPLWKA